VTRVGLTGRGSNVKPHKFLVRQKYKFLSHTKRLTRWDRSKKQVEVVTSLWASFCIHKQQKISIVTMHRIFLIANFLIVARDQFSDVFLVLSHAQPHSCHHSCNDYWSDSFLRGWPARLLWWWVNHNSKYCSPKPAGLDLAIQKTSTCISGTPCTCYRW